MGQKQQQQPSGQQRRRKRDDVERNDGHDHQRPRGVRGDALHHQTVSVRLKKTQLWFKWFVSLYPSIRRLLYSNRSQFVDFIFPAAHYRLGMVIRNPNSQEYSWTLFTAPFHWRTWCLIGISSFLVATVIVLAKKFLLIGQVEHDSQASSTSGYHIWLTTLWFGFATNFGCRYDVGNVNTNFEKIFVLAVLLVGNIVFMSYRYS